MEKVTQNTTEHTILKAKQIGLYIAMLATLPLLPVWLWILWKKIEWTPKTKSTITALTLIPCLAVGFAIYAFSGTPTLALAKDLTNDPQFELSGSGTYKNAPVKIYVNEKISKEITSDASGAFSATVELSEGENHIKASATSLEGKTKTSTLSTITLDKTAPILTLETLPESTSADSITITAHSEPGATLAILNNEQSSVHEVFSNDTLEYSVPLYEGSNVLTVNAIDKAGNTSDEVRAVISYQKPDAATLNAVSTPTPAPAPEAKKLYSVTDVVDGDTLKVNIDGTVETLRLIGIDTPETVDPRKPVQCFGKEASNKAKELLTGKSVELEADSTQGERDIYGRLLRYVRLEDGTSFNERMISEGYAHEYTYDSNPYKYQSEYKQAQVKARESQVGLWAPSTCSGDTTKSAAPTVTATPKPTVKPVPTTAPTSKPQATKSPTTSGPDTIDYDCKDFATQAAAQSYFNSQGGSPSNNVDRLDANHDGVPCEDNP